MNSEHQEAAVKEAKQKGEKRKAEPGSMASITLKL